MRTGLVVLLSLIIVSGHARHVGVVGETFPVAEVSMLDWIGTRLTELQKNGELAATEHRWLERVKRQANRPNPLGLPRAIRHAHHQYVPELVLNQDIVDAHQRVLFLKGTRVNALDNVPTYQPHWLFIDGDDPSQVLFAGRRLTRWPTLKIILTGGALDDMARTLACPVYFDQQGRLTKKLHITHVPAWVSRDGSALMVHEVAMKEGGYAR